MLAFTAIQRLRTVRTFMRLKAGTPSSEEAVVIKPSALPEGTADVARACRISSALLRFHSPQRTLPSLESETKSPAESANENAAMINRAWKASAWADASGKAAYLTHVAHQRRFDGLSITDLISMVDRTWASWDATKKANWVMGAPQGRRALRLLTDVDCGRIPAKGRVAGKHNLGPARHGSSCMGKREARSPLMPCGPSAAAMSCKTPRRHPLTLREWAGSLSTHRTESPSLAHKQGAFDAAVAASHSFEASHHLSVSRLRQRNRWKRELNRMLGGNDSRTFQGFIKEHQQEYENIQAPTKPVTEAPKASSTDTFLNFCDDMNIGSPRKAFVLQKMIPFLDSNEREVSNGNAAPLSLAEVKAAAQRFSQEFDQYRNDILKNCGNSLAVQAYEKALIDEELTQVRLKLNRFQSKIPLLQRIANLCMGL
ncbi:unnamed protein product [Phytomonas sp. EM1]|nr:unnamed protein product [Phytomonas sp. EM1]|eukprot:CCW65288.1 unnamed protein product [Phytomonas sp. isolate EM1]